VLDYFTSFDPEAILVDRVAYGMVMMCLALVVIVLVPPPIMGIMVATTDFDMVKTTALK
jgi:hypothetical protein